MTVELARLFKGAEITWDKEIVTGTTVNILTAPVSGDGEYGELNEVKSGPNDGNAELAYPIDFEGQSSGVVRGGYEGEDDGTIDV